MFNDAALTHACAPGDLPFVTTRMVG